MDQNDTQQVPPESLIILEGLEGNLPTMLNPMQVFFFEHLSILIIFWWTVWFTVLTFLLYKYILIKLLRSHK